MKLVREPKTEISSNSCVPGEDGLVSRLSTGTEATRPAYCNGYWDNPSCEAGWTREHAIITKYLQMACMKLRAQQRHRMGAASFQQKSRQSRASVKSGDIDTEQYEYSCTSSRALKSWGAVIALLRGFVVGDRKLILYSGRYPFRASSTV